MEFMASMGERVLRSQGISGVMGLLNLYHYCVMPSWTLEAISVEAESTVQAENNTECGVGRDIQSTA